MAYSFRLCCAALLALSAPAIGQSQAQPPVFAAWSQIIGDTAPPLTNDIAPPRVEMRFAVETGTGCDQFLLMPTKTTEVVQPSQGVVPDKWADGPLAVKTCRAPMAPTWISASLLYADKVTPVTLTSMINFGNERSDLNTPIKWVAGPSNGKPVNVAGPAAIGQHGDLRMVTLGDTGCRGDDGTGRHFQECSNTALPGSWPLEAMAVEAATLDSAGRAPDLVIHVGDYRYFLERQTPVDTWQLWQKDFFPVAQPLLLAAPWVFGRGNHEGCPGAGDLVYGMGYFQFFGTEADPDCAGLNDGLMQPWYFDVPLAGGNAHRFVVIDANTYASNGPFPGVAAKENFKTAKRMSDNGPVSSWWVWHSPGVQLLHYNGGDHFGDPNILTALMDATGQDTAAKDRYCGTGAACKPSQFLMGHQHLYQDVTFPNAAPNAAPNATADWVFPRQYIIGHGGVDIDQGSNPARNGATCFDGDFPIGANGATVKGQVQTFATHGVIYWERSTATLGLPAGWARSYAWADGSIENPAPNTDPDYTNKCK